MTYLKNCLTVLLSGIAPPDLITFLETNLPKKKKNVVLGVQEAKLAGSITEGVPGLKMTFGGPVTEVWKGIAWNE